MVETNGKRELYNKRTSARGVASPIIYYIYAENGYYMPLNPPNCTHISPGILYMGIPYSR